MDPAQEISATLACGELTETQCERVWARGESVDNGSRWTKKLNKQTKQEKDDGDSSTWKDKEWAEY